jgi:aminoglycoside 6'-N-acetyltransferase I
MECDITIEKITSVKTLEQCAGMYPAAYNAEPWNDNWTCETAAALLSCYYNTPGFSGWTAKRDDRIIGCAIGNIEPYYSGNIFILKEIFVSVSSHGTGAGSSLIAALKDDLHKINIKMVILSTYRSIFDFYVKSGFKEMDGVGTMIYSYEND